MGKIETYTEKTALADDDLFVIADSAASNASKKVKASTVWTTDLLSEKNLGAGITIAGTGGLKTGAAVDFNITSGKNVNITADVNRDIAFTATGAGAINAITGGGTISLTPDSGWTPCNGAENKAGIDSNNVIFTAGALQDLARTVVAIQGVLTAKGYLTV